MRRNNKQQAYIWLLLLGGLALRLILSSFGTLKLDQGTFISWANSLYLNGFRNFYTSWSDYLPGYPYVLWLLGKINTFGVIPEVILFKIPAIFADMATGFLIYKILLKSKGWAWGLTGAALYVFNPAIIFNSTLWGQVDAFTALTSILAIYLLPYTYIFSAISLAVGTLIKPQTAFVFPIIIYLMVKDKKKILDFVKYSLVGLTTFVIAFVPYWNHSNLISFIYERMSLSLGQYPYTSVNAFNFWGLVGSWKPDTVFYQVSGYALVIISSIVLFFKLWKTKNAAYYVSAFVFAASFVFFTRMHERHLLPVFASLAIVAVENPLLLIPYIGLSVTYTANLAYAYAWITQDFKSIFSDFTVKFIELFNIGLVVMMFTTFTLNLKLEWGKLVLKVKNAFKSSKANSYVYKFPVSKLSKNNSKYLLYLILIFAFVSRIYALNSPSTMYFDEVYHAFTAKVILSSETAKAWEWWNTPPEGFAYEWTHPPLAKLGMVLGMLVFGENSFGYRIPGAMLGVATVFLIYLLAKELFKDEVVGLLSAAVFSLDGLALVMSRIGMNDSYILFFILLSVYLYLKDKNFLSAVAFGLALSSKWSAIWAVPIFGIIFLSQRKKINWSYLWFFILPIPIYVASYFDMFLTNHDWGTWWGMQQQMWWYHTGLRATHAYSSSWWSWPMLIRPIYLYTSEETLGMVSRIYAFGNPFVFWFGLISVTASLFYSYFEKNKHLGLVVFSYLIFFVPWALSPRIMFLYHYLPSIPFMSIAVGYVLRRNPKIAPYFFVSTLLVFAYFYPHWTGLNIPIWLDQSYYWFSSWR